jgi:hypothetical protein
VLGSEVVTKAGGGGTKRAPEMTLSSFLEDDGKEKKKAPGHFLSVFWDAMRRFL